VQVVYQPRSGARELYSAADVGTPLTLDTILNWTTEEFRKLHPIPCCDLRQRPGLQPAQGPPIKTGIARNRLVELYKRGNTFSLFCPSWGEYSLVVELDDFEVLEKYFAIVYAQIDWKK
jgi:hypothetical protein